MKILHAVVGPLSTNCYILADDAGNAAVVDPGAWGDRLAELLRQQGLTPELILLTHGHFDHIGGVKKLKAAFPQLRVAIGKEDVPMLSAALNDKMASRYIDRADYEELSADLTVSEGDVLEAGTITLKVIETPGHTRGGVCYLCGNILFSGDTLFFRSVGRTDLDGGDHPSIMRSLKKLAELEGNFQVMPGHERTSWLDDERRQNPYMLEAIKCY